MKLNEIVNEVYFWFHEWHETLQIEFVNCREDDLIRYHSSLGRDIRNYFKLWETAWVPEIVNGVDCSEDHPDNISIKVIEEVWRRNQ
jgi:hypothetical protein